MTTIQLRPIQPDDLPILFEQQLSPAANQMAAFTAKDPADRPGFMAHWAKVMADPSITIRVIEADGLVAGSILCHSWFGEPELSYWLGEEFWGRGIATEALKQFLQVVETRPLFARVVFDNVASQKVLTKCGFVVVGEDKGFAHGRQQEVTEFILKLGI